MKRVMVVGIGNLLMQDDGIGVHLVNRLTELGVPKGVELVDGGTHSYDLVDFFCQADHIIIVDAMRAGGEPGTIYRAPLDQLEIRSDRNSLTSVHELNFIEAMEMVHLLDHYPEVLVFGVEPGSLEISLELSPPVAAKVDRLAELVLQDINKIVTAD